MVLDVSSVHEDDGGDCELDAGPTETGTSRRRSRLLNLMARETRHPSPTTDGTARCTNAGVFKAQSVIQLDIKYNVPKPEDLPYPDIFVGEFSCEKASNRHRHTRKGERKRAFPSTLHRSAGYLANAPQDSVLSHLHDFEHIH
ncbi:hypothetical protein FPV67DRAFT_1518079 [Lyophyllum atratum]|nr:hypothetical protein FPV67DRAFT_1518079 [Lyophyllum atratum]